MINSNFQFLEQRWPEIAQLGETAENYLYTDANACIYKTGLIGEAVIRELLLLENISLPEDATQVERVKAANKAGVLPQSIDNIFYALRKGRNQAVHNALNSRSQASALLRMAYRLCAWFMEVYGDWQFSAPEYHEPEDHSQEDGFLLLLEEQEKKLKELSEKIAELPTYLPAHDDERPKRAAAAAEKMVLSDEESAVLNTEKVRMDLSFDPVIQYALYQNGKRVFRSISITNNSGEDIGPVTLSIHSDSDVCVPWTKEIELLPADQTCAIRDINLSVKAQYLMNITEKCVENLTVTLAAEEVVLCTEIAEAEALPFDQWHGARYYPELLTSFVMPNHPDIPKLTARAAEFLEAWTGDPSLDGYQSKDPTRVRRQAAAIYKALQEQNIVYAEPPASFERSGQRVRLCDAVLQQKMGTCLDLTLLYAGCLEAVGLHPLLVIQKGHIFSGVWLEDLTFADSVQDDATMLTKRLTEGVNELAVIECTLFAAGKHTNFETAQTTAEQELRPPHITEYIIDVRRARLSGITPLPIRIMTENGWRADRPEVSAGDLTKAPGEVGPTVEWHDGSLSAPTRKALWERRLLDLSLKNTLLNMRVTRSMIPLLTADVGALEDGLADGVDFTIVSKPDEWVYGSDKISFDSLQSVDRIRDLLNRELRSKRLRSALPETALANSLKTVYRSAKASLEENGANSLFLALGLLKWYESNRSQAARFAPVLLLPIEMVRKSAAAGYVIRLRDEEPQINITLMEKLRQDFSIQIGGLDPLPEDEHGIDIYQVFAIVTQAIKEMPRWELLNEACIGTFSFSQFVMWNDIHNRAQDLSKNKVVHSLMEGKLTWQAEPMEIGDYVPEDGVFLPVPADASQLFAIESANDGKSFVLHGPPGTGKSQTITALIANALAQGKTVLFVAEKMAALEVVQKRLDRIGLSPFCLELHSNKSKKKDVLEQLRIASEVAKTKSQEEFRIVSERLSELREELNCYVQDLHKVQLCGKTMFTLIGEYEESRSAADIGDFAQQLIDATDPQMLYDQKSALERLIAAGYNIGHPQNHPLSIVHAKQYTHTLKKSVQDSLRTYRSKIEELRQAGFAFSDAIGEERPITFDQYGQLTYLAQALDAFRAFPCDWVCEEDVDTLADHLRAMAAHYINADAYSRELRKRWKPSFLELDGIALMQTFNEQSVKWFVGKQLGMNKLSKLLAEHMVSPVNSEQIGQDLADLIAYQEERSAGELLLQEYREYLREVPFSTTDDWTAILNDANSLKMTSADFRTLTGSDKLRFTYGSDNNVLDIGRDLIAAWEGVFEPRRQLYGQLELDEVHTEDWLTSQTQLCDLIQQNLYQLHEWFTWQEVRAEATKLGLMPVIIAYENGLRHEEVIPAYKKAMARALCEKAIEESSALNCFSGKDFNHKVDQFKRMDGEYVELTQKEIYSRLAARVPNFTAAAAAGSETGVLQRAIRSNGRGMSIRRLFEQIPNLLPRLCPCMLMSPLSVAQYLDPNREPFDLVVFDEASQLPTSKAVGALARGNDAVIVGDPNQMPPTSFFTSNYIDEDHLDVEDLESILDDCLALNMPQTHLLWHYRSRHESLIAFSNRQFYDGRLYTFPSVNDRESKVQLIHVDGVYESGSKRYNRAEAEAIVAELQRRCHHSELSKKSVGVVTFNISQQNLIDDLLVEACKSDAALEAWAYGSSEPVFIKNLENVQGDERDVILFSVGYGPDHNGKVSMNFGPLNRDGGWRRLNVAVSRARYEMIVFSTLEPEQIDLSRSSARGVAALKDFLEFAQQHSLAQTEETIRHSVQQSGIADSVAQVLNNHGYKTVKSVGTSAYRIDIGVVDPGNPEKYLLGILLDGPTYHDSKTSRDRELGQLQVLADLGWNITRIWSMDWWENRERETNRVLSILKDLEQKLPRVEPQQPIISEDENEPSTTCEPLRSAAPSVQDGRAELPTRSVKIYRHAVLSIMSISADDLVRDGSGYRRKTKVRVKQVLDQEAPISESLLTKRVIQAYNINRVGSRLQDYMKSIYRSMNLTSTTQGGERFFWSDLQRPSAYREFRVSGSGDDRREPKDIPVEEAANAICRVLEDQFSLETEDLIRETGKLMGYSRTGSNVSTVFASAISFAEKNNRIRKAQNGMWLLI